MQINATTARWWRGGVNRRFDRGATVGNCAISAKMFYSAAAKLSTTFR
ncbi:MAG: hypothetical protein JWQ94_3407 [Tardiphaga sp.]|jgi:hypothetical protein|nr:hypothetical protein [Tardiphaga sp.]